MNSPVEAITNVIMKRIDRGASDKSLIDYCNHLKTVWKSVYMQNFLNDMIDGIKQTPIK